MEVQVDFFNTTRKQLDEILGESKAKEFLMKKSIFSVTIGSNDFLNNYLFPLISATVRLNQSPDSFIDEMINTLKTQLTVISSLYFSDTFSISIQADIIHRILLNLCSDYAETLHS